MTVAHSQCPNCHQAVPEYAKACPHCGVYLQLPAQSHAESLLGVAQAAAQAPLAPMATAQSLPDALKQLDATANTQITISGVLVAFYAGAIFASKIQAPAFEAFIYSSPVVLLLVTIILSVRVFYSAGYLKDDYSTLLRIKEARLRA